MADDRDLTPDNGQRPPFAKPDPARGDIGSEGGYSGQEYDAPGQAAWREADAARQVAPQGDVEGTGSPAEEIDPETPGAPVRAGQDDETRGPA